MNQMNPRDCIALLRSHRVPVHIIRHSVQVFKVAVFLTHMINRNHEHHLSLDIGLIAQGALLHDIAKPIEIKRGFTGTGHAEMGGEILKAMGHRSIARIVRQHVQLDRPVSCYERPDESLIVNYADKRVKHTEIVTLDERFSDLMVRYGRTEEARNRMERMYHETRAMEELLQRYIAPVHDSTCHFPDFLNVSGSHFRKIYEKHLFSSASTTCKETAAKQHRNKNKI